MKNMVRMCVLIDQPLSGDRRVQTGVATYEAAGVKVEVIDILEPVAGSLGQRLLAYVKSFSFFLFKVLPHIIVGYRSLRRMVTDHRAMVYPGWQRGIVGWRGAWRETVAAFHAGALTALKTGKLDLIHANDLRALSFALGMASVMQAPIIYDSHELALFRNRRKQSWLRLLMMFGYERAGYRAASATMTVSRPIARFMDDLHGQLGDSTLVAVNNIYTGYFLPLGPAEDERVAILYFGAANEGRGIESLIDLAHSHPQIYVACFFTGNIEENEAWMTRVGIEADVKVHVQNRIDYRSDAENYVRGFGKVFSWIFMEDVCLSHKYTVVNKLFQALAFGLPSLTPAGGYIGEVVEKNGLGLIMTYPDSAARAMIAISAQEYSEMRERSASFNVSSGIGIDYAAGIHEVIKRIGLKGFDV